MSPKKAESGGRPLAGHYPQPGGCRVVKSYVVSTSIPSDPGRHRPPERPAPRRCTPAGCQRSLPATGAWTPSHDPPPGGLLKFPPLRHQQTLQDLQVLPGGRSLEGAGQDALGDVGAVAPTPRTEVARLSTFSTMGNSFSSSSMGLFLLLYQKRRPKGRLLCVWCAGVDHSAEII